MMMGSMRKRKKKLLRTDLIDHSAEALCLLYLSFGNLPLLFFSCNNQSFRTIFLLTIAHYVYTSLIVSYASSAKE